MASLFVGAATLAGCAGPTHGLVDIEQAANATLDLAETILPGIADALGATITRVNGHTQSGGGTEGNVPEVVFRVEGVMAGPEPTQEQMIQALVDAGLVDVEPPVEYGNPTNAIQAVATSADGGVLVSFGYQDRGYPNRVFSFVFQSAEFMRISHEDVDTFDRTFPREVDQSLVHEVPEA